jgi:hypothetical protein
VASRAVEMPQLILSLNCSPKDAARILHMLEGPLTMAEFQLLGMLVHRGVTAAKEGEHAPPLV